MNRILFAASVISGVSLAAAAHAMQEPQQQPGPRCGMEQVDKNGDGEITLEEIEAARAERFKAADTDGSGGLSREEIEAARQHRREMRRQCDPRQMRFNRLDADGDGKITREENAAAANARFDRMDANGDGVLTIDEMPARMHRGHPHRK